MKKVIALAVLVAVGFAVSASAFTFEKSKVTIGVMPVYSMPQGDMGDTVDGSLGLGVSGEYLVQDNIKVGLDLGYAFSYGAKGATKTADKDFDIKVLNIGPMVKYFMTKDKFTYYGVAGLGLYNWTSAKIGTIIPSDSGTDFGFNIGVGGSYEINNNWTGGLDLRYHSVGGDLDANLLNLGFKFDYKF